MGRKVVFIAVVVLSLVLLPVGALAKDRIYTPGAPGLGDPYFPLAGNGGYDVQSYLLDLKYDPATDFLSGQATIKARATQDLSQFNLDFEGLTIHSITVNKDDAEWSRAGGELTVFPDDGLRARRLFTVVVRYDGVPQTINDPALGIEGFIHTDDGAVVAGEPRAAATWFPVNDHPLDKAAYTVKLTVPKGLEAISNGTLQSTRTRDDWTTWTWKAREPMAPYLVTAAIGHYKVSRYKEDGIKYWDAIDSALFKPVAAPRTGTQLAISQAADLSYKRLARTISVPANGAQLAFWVNRDTETNWDFMFVEAHTPGQDDWTTLPDANGHTSQDTGFSCPYWHQFHPFLTHYQTDAGNAPCTPTGTSGAWYAATGTSDGAEQWSVDLSKWAGGKVEVSISYASDDVVQYDGVFVDDIVVSTGEGSTSFENDGDTLDGWAVPGAPAGSEPNTNDWIVGTATNIPDPIGVRAQRSLNREPEIIDFLSDLYGDYPFSAAGGIVDSNETVSFALETQTRPIYTGGFFRDQLNGDSVVVHELSHQWVGDKLSVARWQEIWLNEGFASYTEWLWSEHEGLGTAQQIFDSTYNNIPADSPFWNLVIGDPGPERLFAGAVYTRGAMTLHQLRLAVGDEAFFKILRKWTSSDERPNVTTAQFIALAEKISGKELSPLFDTWLYTPGKPTLNDGAAAARTSAVGGEMPAVAKRMLKQVLHPQR